MVVTLDKETHIYRAENGEIVPGATSILTAGGFIDVRWFTERGRENGTAGHEACHYADEGDLDRSSLSERTAGQLEGWNKFCDDFDFQPILIEQAIGSELHWFACTLDRFGTMRGRPATVEIKCGAVQPWAKLQTALQCVAIEERGDALDIDIRGAVQLLWEKRSYKWHPFTDHETDKMVALGAVASYHWKRNNGIKTKGDDR